MENSRPSAQRMADLFKGEFHVASLDPNYLANQTRYQSMDLVGRYIRGLIG